MKLFGFDISLSRKSNGLSIDTVLRRLEAMHETVSGIAVTPDTAIQSPTVHALVTAISKRIATLPVRVMLKTTSKGRDSKEVLPNHPAARVLRQPNDWQDRVTFWLDATSWLVRHGNFYAFKARGQTGPVRRLEPIAPGAMTVKQDADFSVSYEATLESGGRRTFSPNEILHARGAARNGFLGDSPVNDVRQAIALEIAAERMGATVFGNSAQPGVIFEYTQGTAGHKTDEERKKFADEFDEVYAKRGRFRSLLLPKGISLSQALPVENEKAQFLATRQYQRTVIAGAFGVPPHLVGDLSKGTFNNVEQQSLQFVSNVVLPYARIFEAALERALLTDEDRRIGIIIRFNLDAALRADFKTRQEGLAIQRQNGVINSNEWREQEGMNPISEEDGGEEYYRQGPSGQSADGPSDGGEGNAPADDPDETPDEGDEENDD